MNNFKEATSFSLNSVSKLNTNKKCTFLIPTKFISEEAAQVGFLLSNFFNRDKKSQRIFKTFFSNSKYEALHGAIKISRHNSYYRGEKNKNLIAVYNLVDKNLNLLFNPLGKESNIALIPNVYFFDSFYSFETFVSSQLDCLAGIVICPDGLIDIKNIIQIFQLCINNKIITTLNYLSSEYDNDSLLYRLPFLPDIIISGEELTNYEIPFGCFSMAEEIYQPWNTPETCFTHSSTYGGNRLALTAVREKLLQLADRKSIDIAKSIEKNKKNRLKYFSKYVNNTLVRLYSLAGLDIDPVQSHGSFLTINSDNKIFKIIDCVAGGGTAIRGHTPSDLVADVINLHEPEKNYWQTLLSVVSNLAGGDYHAFPAISGTTAVEIAISTALIVNSNRSRIIIFKGNYAGKTLISLIGTKTDDNVQQPFQPLYSDVCYIDPENKDAEQILLNEIKSNKIALIWLEVVQGAHDVLLPKELTHIIEMYKKEYDYLVGVDEILMGLYRSGKVFSYENIINKPDVITLSKALSDGTFPMAMTLVTNSLYAIAKNKKPVVMQVFDNLYVNQLGSHIALNCINKITSKNLAEKVNKVSNLLMNGLQKIVDSSPYVKKLKGVGLSFHMAYNFDSPFIKLFGSLGNNLFVLFMCSLCLKEANVFLFFDRYTPALTLDEEEANLLVKNLEKVFYKNKYRIYPRFLIYAFKVIFFIGLDTIKTKLNLLLKKQGRIV